MKCHFISLAVFISSIILISCNNEIPKEVERALREAGKNKVELERVIQYYRQDNDTRKIKAVYYLLENSIGQFHYDGEGVEEYRKVFQRMDSLFISRGEVNVIEVWDSLQPRTNRPMRKIYDLRVVKADLLIETIDRAFVAWQYPWAQELPFEDFCEYLLPYKLKNETPQEWRSFFQNEYRWVLDSMKNSTDPRKACSLINDDLKKRFYITKLKCPFDLAFNDLIKLRSGRCTESTQLTAYAMRAMGIPVTLDYVTNWANRNGAHDWNGLFIDGKTIAFLGTEVNPGSYKIEYPMPGSMKSKRAKVFRRTFTKENSILPPGRDWERIPKIFRDLRIKDVTAQYVPVANVNLENNTLDKDEIAYLSIFNYPSWRPCAWTSIGKNGQITFLNMGKGILYLPCIKRDSMITPIGQPFVLMEDGTIDLITPKKGRVQFSIDRKYPVNDDNKIIKGMSYELFYWNRKWISLQTQVAIEESLTFNNVPEGALFWLHNLQEGTQERLFTINKGHVNWW